MLLYNIVSIRKNKCIHLRIFLMLIYYIPEIAAFNLWYANKIIEK